MKKKIIGVEESLKKDMTVFSNFQLISFIFIIIVCYILIKFFYFINNAFESATWAMLFVLFFGFIIFILMTYFFVLFSTYYLYQFIDGFKKYSRIYFWVIFSLAGLAIFYGVYHFFEGWKGIIGLLGTFFISFVVYLFGPKIRAYLSAKINKK